MSRPRLILLAAIATGMLMLSSFLIANAQRPDPRTVVLPARVTCRDFTTWASAQEAYRGGAHWLDHDRDGVACESLPGAP